LSGPIFPPVAGDEDLASWSESWWAPLEIGSLWARYSPRGRGWVARKLGRTFGKGAKRCLRTGKGALLAIEPATLDTYVSIRVGGGTWNAHVLKICIQALRTGDVYYDIGANVGYLSIEIAAHFRDEVQVVAFEPQHNLAKCIATSAALNDLKRVHVSDLMLSSSAGDAVLFVPEHSIHASSIGRTPGAVEVRCTKVTLDSVASGLPAPNLIKIDVEGAEFDVIQGARETIAAHRPLIVFESDQNADRYGYSRAGLLNLIRSLGDYHFVFVSPAGMSQVDPANIDSVAHSDILAVPASQVSRLRAVCPELPSLPERPGRIE
jgi:FkbM family methyltransferase